jgi:hypothetical protein
MLYKEYVKEILIIIDQLKLATEKDSFLYSVLKPKQILLLVSKLLELLKQNWWNKIQDWVGTASGMTEVQDELYQLVQ